MDKLKQFVKVFEWMDKARWEGNDLWDEGWKHENVQSLSAEQKILAHWITYICDMQMPAKLVWANGLPVFATLVQRYKNVKSSGEIRGLLPEKYTTTKENGKNKVNKICDGNGFEFTPRFPNHYEQIQRTLEILLCYKNSLVQFMESILEKYHGESGLRRLAHALYLLTYANPTQDKYKEYSVEYTREILHTDEKLDKAFQEWDKTTTKGGQKRLWAALRDYVKHEKLRSFVEESFPLWKTYCESSHLSELELPGDLWNDRFADNLVCILATNAGINVKKKRSESSVNSTESARLIYNAIKEADNSALFYPEQLDVSFDFAPRMCDKYLCDICIFGGNKVIDFCSKPGSPKLCPVLMILTGYRKICDVEHCPIMNNNNVAGLCSGYPVSNITEKQQD